MEQPFENYDVAKHAELVVHGNDRPKLDTKKWSGDLCNMMSQCWSVNISERPDFEHVSTLLRREFDPFLSASEAGGLDESNKTAKSMEGR